MYIPPDISIITVNYNGIDETRALVQSLKEHLHSLRYELIIVDNGSYNNEALYLQQEYPEHVVIRSEKNLGFAGGNNLGIGQAKGEYIFLLNNDTVIKDNSIHFLTEHLRNNPAIGAVSPKIKFATPPCNIQFAGFTPMSKYTVRNHSVGFNEADRNQYDIPQPSPFLHGAALMFKREILDTVGKMPEIYFLYYEEMEWCHRMVQQGYQLWYEPRCTIFHKESSSTGQDSPLKTYYLTRNRLLYAFRNDKGIDRFIAIFYQVCIANLKNIILNLLKGKTQQTKVIFTACRDFFLLKNKHI